MVKLTERLVLCKAKRDSLEDVKNLNVWGNALSDISLLQRMPNVEVASLSLNAIQSLKDFSNCLNLKELYLRKNNILDLSEISYLKHLKDLRVLWLSGNPCAEVDNYRLKVVSVLSQLDKLDDDDITPEEKTNAALFGSGQYEPSVDKSDVSDKQSLVSQRSTPEKNLAQIIATPSSQQQYQQPYEQIQEIESEQNYVYQVQQRPPSQNYYVDQEYKQEIELIQPGAHQQNVKNRRLSGVPYNPTVATPINNVNHSPNNQPSTPLPNRNNILTAVLSLLQELDPERLRIIKQECDTLLSSCHHY